MYGYIVMDKVSEVTDGSIDFSRLDKTIYSTIGEAIMQMDDKQCVMQFEFLDNNELVRAVNAAIIGSVISKFHIRIIASYHKTTYV